MMTKVLEMTVRDIMQTDVTTVGPGTSVRELTRVLSDRGISGVPVVTASGAVVGVVSSTDVVRLAAEETGGGTPDLGWSGPGEGGWGRSALDDDPSSDESSASYFLPEDVGLFGTDWDGDLGTASFDDYSVSDIMTPVSFAMPPTASVRDLADFLLRGRIHRAVVIDEGHLVGIVTTMDVLRALAEGQL